ncbi:MAG: InlB B-repeat-containing protein [Clostridia bacterium]|nr:InlB B-repeat-containing protein [Clostridia bacterium]
MTKVQAAKRSWSLSVVALLLCISMLIGTTYAWFTDNVTSAGNIITSGNLDLEMYWTDDPATGTWHDVEDPAYNKIFDYDKWEPGYTEVRYIKLVNAGNLALNYQLTLTPEGSVGKLAEVINVYAAEGEVELKDRSDLSKLGAMGLLTSVLDGGAAAEGTLLAEGQESLWHDTKETVLTIAMSMITTAGNEYQDESVGDGFSIKALATQCPYEKDSFGSDYDSNAEYPVSLVGKTASAAVKVQDGKVAEAVTISGNGISAIVPAGVAVKDGTEKLTVKITPLKSTTTDITVVNNEILIPVDVHVEGVAEGNTVPIIVDLGEILPKYLNMGNYALIHVEDGVNNTMTFVNDKANLNAHNQFTYEPLTGAVTVSMASFSEVALVADTSNPWNGIYNYEWYKASETSFTICNADQLAGMGKIVGGMADGIDKDTFSGDTIKLISDINLNGGKATVNGKTKVFYPIGYYNKVNGEVSGIYDRTDATVEGKTGVSSNVSSFSGTFDGNGHTITDFYQNTWEMFGDYNDGYSGTPNYYKDAMGLFGYVNGGTVKNLTVDNFSSDGEFTPTGVIAAYAVKSTFENIAITHCNPRVYNTGNGGIVGIGGNSDDPDTYRLTFKNITIDNTNKITALWGSWDVACGGLVGMFRGAGHVDMNNCHVAAQMDVYNDVCGNYQYYWYRYSGMMVGTNKNMKTDADGYTVPETDKFHAENCTVHFGKWNDYYYCELVANSLASYTHDHQFSRLEVIDKLSDISDDEGTTWKKTGNFLLISGDTKTCYHIVKNSDGNLKRHLHTDAGYEESIDEDGDGNVDFKEDKQIVYLPFNQLFTGYGWGVKHIPIYDDGALNPFEGVTILDRVNADSVEKFETKFTGDFLYRVGNGNTVNVGSLFKVIDEFDENGTSPIKVNKNSNVQVTITKVDEKVNVSGTFTANTSDWTKGTIQFSGTGLVKVTIQDYIYCKPTTLILEVVDAINATAATSATANNVVLLNDIGSGFTVSGRYAVYGNGFTLNYTGNGQYLNNGLKQGVVNISENGVLDNLHIKASIYPTSYLYYEEVKKGPSTIDGDKTRYHYQLSAVVAKGNATISNCYIYGGRNNIFVDTGDVTIKDTVLECGTLSNIQIQSTSDYTVTLEDVTTIQHRVNATIVDTTQVMLGAGVIVGPDSETNPEIALNGEFKQYNWVTAEDKNDVTNSTAQTIIQTALNATAFNHTVNGETASNLGIIYLNNSEVSVKNDTGLPYELGTVTMSVSGVSVNGRVYSLQKATAEQIYSDYEKADRATVNGLYQPQFKYSADLGGQYVVKTDDGDEHCYREGDTIHVMFPSGDTKELNLASLVDIAKYSGQDLDLEIACKDENNNAVAVTDRKISLSDAGKYIVTYTVTDTLFYDKNGETVTNSIEYSWNVTLNVSLKDAATPDAYFGFDSTKQKMGYYKPSWGDVKQYLPFLAGLKIYDYNGQTSYLRFDGDADFNKVASVTITGYASNKASLEVKLTDGGVINTQFLARANSGGASTYTGKIKTSNNTIYFVNDGGTSNKDTTTTAAYWYVDYYKFTGNNGVAIQSAQQTFNSTGSSASTPSGSFSTTIKYTVTYEANGGNCGQKTGYATSASTAVTLPTPTRSGYVFAGWYTAASGGTKVGGAGDSYTPSANITLYAQWGKPCTVTYNANGGSCGTASEKYSGTALTLPTPTRDGYWFVGWYDAATDGNKIGDAGATYNPSGEITLYAHWQEKVEYTVTYNANGGTCGTASATYQGAALTLPTPTRTGYTFNGWYTAASGGDKIGDAGASYTPSANITLYAQWEQISYTITISKQENATVTIDKTTAHYNDTISVTVSFSENNSKTLTVKDASGNTVLSKSAAGTYTFTMPASNVTVEASSSGACFTPDTLITLSDGTQKRVDEVTFGDKILAWDFFTGSYVEKDIALLVNHGEALYEVANLQFSDDTMLRIIAEHGVFDYDLNRYVYITVDNMHEYIGHRFVQYAEDGEYRLVTLTNAFKTEELTSAWSITSADSSNAFASGLLTVAPPEDFYDWIEMGGKLVYDVAQFQKDVETYGLYTYEDFKDYVTYEQFVSWNGAYLKIAVEKGYFTFDYILELIELYKGWMPQN